MAEEKKQFHRRKQHFIKKGYQARFIFKFCLLVLVGGLLSTGLLYALSRGTLTSSFENSRLTVESTSVAILPAVVYTNLITLLLITVATILVVLYVSHKIAGPLFRFEKDLSEIAQGDLTKVIRLRRKDEVKDMAETLNRMTASLRERLVEVQARLDEAAEQAEEDGASDAVKEKLFQAQSALKRRFKV